MSPRESTTRTQTIAKNGNSFEPLGRASRSDSDLCREKATDHEYQNVFYHSEVHRWIECQALEQRALPP